MQGEPQIFSIKFPGKTDPQKLEENKKIGRAVSGLNTFSG
jgi:hypothetical protein